jgi:hypothetical protein
MNNESYANITSGRLTVTTAGTRVRFPDVPCRRVDVYALTPNTNAVTVGGSGVVGAAATRVGIPLLAAGGKETFYVQNAQQLYLDSITNGEGVTYMIYN